jgi:hypothetical protein
MLKDKIAAIEVQMKAKLEEARATFTHPGDKGTSVEDSFRAFLRQYLSRRLEVGNGEIIDCEGQRSTQTDVVIVSEDHPFTFTSDLPGLFFIEGVCAAGEVKTNLTSTELEKAIKNSCQFKQLETDPGQGTLASANPSDLERFYKRPPWFLVAFESQLTLSNIQSEIEEFGSKNSVEPNKLIDAVFVLGRGWVINFGDGKDSFQFRTPEGISREGWVWQNSDSILFDLLGWLSAVMPRMIRFEPILPKYIRPRK